MKLKSVIAIMFAMPVIAFGGTTCYQATSAVPAQVPSVLCLESISDTVYVNTLNVESADGSVPSVLKIISSSRHNEERLNFVAAATLVSFYESGCGSELQADLIVKGQLAYTQIDEKALEVSVQTNSRADTCHSRPQSDVITYKLVK